MKIYNQKMASVVFIRVSIDTSVILTVVFTPHDLLVSFKLDTEIAVRPISLGIEIDLSFNILSCNIVLFIHIHEDCDIGIPTSDSSHNNKNYPESN